ncbi:hypothetical protein [Pantoea sp. A4]|uniref:hypothetical protein n=1 Tax=Pantoea sp. A4 TaxID=1225184 RepID=UPI00036B852A|nr:hypothetical protein [Pantoea sp. A4]
MGFDNEQLSKNEDVNEEANESVKVSGNTKNSSDSRKVNFNLLGLTGDSSKQMGIADIKAAGTSGLGWLQQSDGVMGLVINYGMNVVWNVAVSWIELQIDEWREKLDSWSLEKLNSYFIAQGQEPIAAVNKLTTSPTNSSAALTREAEGAGVKHSTEKNVNAVDWPRIQSLIKEISTPGSLVKRIEASIQFIDLIKKLESDLHASFYGMLIPEGYKDKSANHKMWINEFKVYLQTALRLVKAYEKSQTATSWEKMLALGIDDVVASLHLLKSSLSGNWIKANATRAMKYVKGNQGENNSLVGQIPQQWDWDEIIYLTEYGGALIKYYNDIQELPAEKNPLDFVSKALSHNTHSLPEPLAGWLQAIGTAFDSFRMKLGLFDHLGTEVQKEYKIFVNTVEEMQVEPSPWIKITYLYTIIANHYKFFNQYLAPLTSELTGLNLSNNYSWDLTKETFALMEVQDSLNQFDGIWDFLLNEDRHRALKNKTKNTVFTKELVGNFSDLRHKMPEQVLGAGGIEILESYLRYRNTGNGQTAVNLTYVIIKQLMLTVYRTDRTFIIDIARYIRNAASEYFDPDNYTEWKEGDGGIKDEQAIAAFDYLFYGEGGEIKQFISSEVLFKVSESIIGSNKYTESLRAFRNVYQIITIMHEKDKDIRTRKIEDLQALVNSEKDGWSRHIVGLASWFNFVNDLIEENPQTWDVIKNDIWGSWTSWGHFDRDLLVSKTITRLLVNQKIKQIITDSLRQSGKKLSLKNTETVATLLMNYWTHENVMNLVQPHIHVNQYGLKEAATGLANLGGYVAKGAANTVIGGVNLAVGVTRGAVFQAKKLAIAVTRELIRNHTSVLAVLGVGAAAYLASSVPQAEASNTGYAAVDQATEDFDTLTHLLQDAATYLVTTGSGFAAGYVGMQSFSSADKQDNEKLNKMTFEQLERERTQYDNKSLMANVIGSLALLIPVGDMAYKGWKIYKKGKSAVNPNNVSLEGIAVTAPKNNDADSQKNNGDILDDVTVEAVKDPLLGNGANTASQPSTTFLDDIGTDTENPYNKPLSEGIRAPKKGRDIRFIKRERWRLLAGFASGLIGGAAFSSAVKIKEKQEVIKRILKSRGLYFTLDEIDILLEYLNSPWGITDGSEIDELIETEFDNELNGGEYIPALDSPAKGNYDDNQMDITSVKDNHSRNKRNIPPKIYDYLRMLGNLSSEETVSNFGSNPYDTETSSLFVPYHILHWFRGYERLLFMNQPHRAQAWKYIENNYDGNVGRYLDSHSGSNFLKSYVGDIKRIDQLKDTLESLKMMDHHYVPDAVERKIENITLNDVISKIYAKGNNKGFIERMSCYHVTAISFYPKSLFDRIEKSGFTEKMTYSYIWLNRMSDESKSAFDKAVQDNDQAEQKKILLAEREKINYIENKEETLSALEFILGRVRKVLLDLKSESSINDSFNSNKTSQLFNEIYPYFIEVLNEYTLVSRASNMTLVSMMKSFEKKESESFLKSGIGDFFSNNTEDTLKNYSFLLWDQIKIFGNGLKKDINEIIKRKLDESTTPVYLKDNIQTEVSDKIADIEKKYSDNLIFPKNISRNFFELIKLTISNHGSANPIKIVPVSNIHALGEALISRDNLVALRDKIFRRITFCEDIFVSREYAVVRSSGEYDRVMDFLSNDMKLSKSKLSSQLEKHDVIYDGVNEKITEAAAVVLKRGVAFGWENALKSTINTMLDNIQTRDNIPENKRINADTLVMVNYNPEPGLASTIGRIIAAPNKAIRDYDKTLRNLKNPENIFEESVLKVISYYRQRNTPLTPKNKGNWALPYTSIIYEHEELIKEVSESEDFETLLTDIIDILEGDDEIRRVSDDYLKTSFEQLFSYAGGNENQGVKFIDNTDNDGSGALTPEEKDALIGSRGVEKYLQGSRGSTHIYQVSALYLNKTLRENNKTGDVIPREWGPMPEYRHDFYSVPLANVFFIPVDSRYDTSSKYGLLYNSVTKTLARLPLYWRHTNWFSSGGDLFYSKALQDFLVSAISIKNKKENWFDNKNSRSPVGLTEKAHIGINMIYAPGADNRATTDVPLEPLPAFEFSVIDYESQLKTISHSQSFTKMREDVDASVISVDEEFRNYMKNYLDTFITLFTLATLPIAPSFGLTWSYSLFLAFDFLINTISVSLAFQLSENKDEESDAWSNLMRTYIFWFAGGMGGDAVYEVISTGLKYAYKTITDTVGRSAKYKVVSEMANDHLSILKNTLNETMTITKRLNLRKLYNRTAKLSGNEELLILQDLKSYKWSSEEIKTLNSIEKKHIDESAEFGFSHEQGREDLMNNTLMFLQSKLEKNMLPIDLPLKSAQEYITILNSRLNFFNNSDDFLRSFYEKFVSYINGVKTVIDYKYFKDTFGFDSTTTNIIFYKFKSNIIRLKGYSNSSSEISESVYKKIAILEVAKSLNITSKAATIISQAATYLATRGTWFTPTEGVLNFYSIYFGEEETQDEPNKTLDGNIQEGKEDEATVNNNESATEATNSNVSNSLKNYPKYAEKAGVPIHYIYPDEQDVPLMLVADSKFDNLLNFDFLNYDKDSNSFSARVLREANFSDNEISIKYLRWASVKSRESDEIINFSNSIRVIFSTESDIIYDDIFPFYGSSSGDFRNYLIFKIASRINDASDDFKLGELEDGKVVAKSNGNKKRFYFSKNMPPVSIDILFIKNAEMPAVNIKQIQQQLTDEDFIQKADGPTYLDMRNLKDFNVDNKLIFRASENVTYYGRSSLDLINSVNLIQDDSLVAIAESKIYIRIDIGKLITFSKEIQLIKPRVWDPIAYAGDIAFQIATFINENNRDVRLGVLINGVIKPRHSARNNVFYQSKYESRKVNITITFGIDRLERT